jgi:hypothetical protein
MRRYLLSALIMFVTVNAFGGVQSDPALVAQATIARAVSCRYRRRSAAGANGSSSGVGARLGRVPDIRRAEQPSRNFFNVNSPRGGAQHREAAFRSARRLEWYAGSFGNFNASYSTEFVAFSPGDCSAPSAARTSLPLPERTRLRCFSFGAMFSDVGGSALVELFGQGTNMGVFSRCAQRRFLRWDHVLPEQIAHIRITRKRRHQPGADGGWWGKHRQSIWRPWIFIYPNR